MTLVDVGVIFDRFFYGMHLNIDCYYLNEVIVDLTLKMTALNHRFRFSTLMIAFCKVRNKVCS